MARGSWTLRLCVTLSFGGGLALPLLISPSPASAAAGPTVVPITTFAVSSTQCDGPTYLPTLYQNNLFPEVEAEFSALEGQPPGSGGGSIPTVSSCSPPPVALAPVAGRASVSSNASPDGSATVTAQATGNAVAEESAQMNITLSAAIPLRTPASSVVVSIPYVTTGLSRTGRNDAHALVSFGQAPGAIMCTDGSYGLWSLPPGQHALSAPLGPASGTGTVPFSCPDGSDLAPGVVGFGADVLTWAFSDNGQMAAASANIDTHDVTATINP